MTYQNSPNMGGEAEMVEKGGSHRKEIYLPWHMPCTLGWKQNGIFITCVAGWRGGAGRGWGRGEVPLFAEEEAAWQVPTALRWSC